MIDISEAETMLVINLSIPLPEMFVNPLPHNAAFGCSKHIQLWKKL